MNPLKFLTSALMNPLRVGSIWPSSERMGISIAKFACEGSPQHILELGAGSGAVTKKLLDNMQKSCSLTALELEPSFMPDLISIDDSRLSVKNMSAQNFLKNLQSKNMLFDSIVCGLPFSFIGKKATDEILLASKSSLKPGGRFVLYQCTTVLLTSLKTLFEGSVESKRIFANIPPLVIMIARKANKN